MSVTTLGLLQPGAMGATIGWCATHAVPHVLWASAGRSGASVARAAKAKLEDAGTVADLVRRSEVIVSVCPPHAAEDVAREVAGHGFRGLFADANALSPAHSQQVGAIVAAAGATFVDGGIIGGPVEKAGTTRLYLSGDGAAEVAACFAGSPLGVIVLEGGIGAASALKMAYAAQTKGYTALLAATMALARANGVEAALQQEWERGDLYGRALKSLEGAAPKAWRWVGEMEEIAASFEAAGLPGGFHLAAADLYRRLEQHADAAPPPAGSTLVQELLDAGQAVAR